MTYKLSRLSGPIGAEISGLDLAASIDKPTREALNHALVEHAVLVLRDQHLTAHQMLAASQLFGERFPQKHQHRPGFRAITDCPDVHYISNEDTLPNGRRFVPGRGWHTDHSNVDRPPKAIMLYAVKLPADGGDTQFIDLRCAYDALPKDMKDRIDGLKAVHAFGNPREARSRPNQDGRPPGMVHPLVRTHPESRRKSIFINPARVCGVYGMVDEMAVELLDALFDHAVQPCFEYRHRWHLHDLVIWDNRCLIHKANGDYDMSEVRKLYRIMLQGDAPF